MLARQVLSPRSLSERRTRRLVDEARALLRTRFGMGHVTVQPDAAPLYEPL